MAIYAAHMLVGVGRQHCPAVLSRLPDIKMAQQVKSLVAKPDDLKSHGRRRELPQVSSDLHIWTVAHKCAQSCT